MQRERAERGSRESAEVEASGNYHQDDNSTYDNGMTAGRQGDTVTGVCDVSHDVAVCNVEFTCRRNSA